MSSSLVTDRRRWREQAPAIGAAIVQRCVDRSLFQGKTAGGEMAVEGGPVAAVWIDDEHCNWCGVKLDEARQLADDPARKECRFR